MPEPKQVIITPEELAKSFEGGMREIQDEEMEGK